MEKHFGVHVGDTLGEIEAGRQIVLVDVVGDFVSFRLPLGTPFYEVALAEIRNPAWLTHMREKRWFTPELETALLANL